MHTKHIVQFISLGPKNYGYRTNTGQETCKVRGFTLNYTNSKLINLDTMEKLLTTKSHTSNTEQQEKKKPSCITIANPNKISRDKLKRKLYNRHEDKQYRKVYTKRRILDNYDIVPYGY